jgi:hypothetical protein
MDERLETFVTDACLLAETEHDICKWATLLSTLGYTWTPRQLMSAANSTRKGPHVIVLEAQADSTLSVGLAVLHAPGPDDNDDVDSWETDE